MSTDNLNKVLFQLRRIVILFFTDAACTFSDFFDASKNGVLSKAFQYYCRFSQVDDEEVYRVYDHLCKRLPGLATFILTSDETLFQDEFIHANELEDACILPAVDFRYFFRAAGVTQEIKDAIWTYIQSFLMLTLNDCNPIRKESNERLQKFLQGDETDDESLNDFMQLFENMDESNQNFEEITSKLNAFFEEKLAESGGGGGGVGAMDEEGEDGAMDQEAEGSGPSAPFFEPEKAKDFMENMTNSKIGRIAQEVMEDFKRDHPEILREFEQLVASAYENSQMKPLSLLKFILSKGVSLRTLVKLLMDKLKEKIRKGDITMQDFQQDMPNFMPDLQKFSQSDLKSMMEQSGIKIPSGARFGLDMEKLRRQQEAEKSAQRMRERLAKQRKQTESAMNIATASVSGFTAEEAGLWASNAHNMTTTTQQQSFGDRAAL